MASQENEDNMCFSCQIPFHHGGEDNADKCGDDCGLCIKCCPRTKQCGCGCFFDTHKDSNKSKCKDDCTKIRSCSWCGKDCLPFNCLCTGCLDKIHKFYYKDKK